LRRVAILGAGHDVGVIAALTDQDEKGRTHDNMLELHDASRMTLSPRAA
jgi:hypothetical protein